MNALEISHISKHFGDKQVLSDVSLTVPENCIFGFIGRNGAGKTTTMKAVLGLIPIDSGNMSVCGEQVTYGNSPANRFIGYLPDVPEFYGSMTAAEYLTLCGEISKMKSDAIKKRSSELLEMVGLSDEKHRIKGFSRGMKQRLGIAQALMNRPKLLICDEPTSALDPIGRKEILDILLAAKSETSVIFSTHILSDVERICSKIALLEGGKIAAEGTLEEMMQKHGNRAVELIPERTKPTDLLRFFPNAVAENDRLVFSDVSQADMEQIMQTIILEHIAVERLERREASLEQLFLEVTAK